MIPEPCDQNREVPVNETFHEQTEDELIEKELKRVEADDQAIQTILLGLPVDIYVVVDSCEMLRQSDRTTAMNMALVLMAKAFKLNYSTPANNYHRILSNPCNRQIAQPVQNVRNQVFYNAVLNPSIQNVGNQNGLIVVPIANQNSNGNGRDEGNVNRNNGIQLQAEEFDLMDVAANLDEIKEVNANCILMANLKQASTSGTQIDKAPAYDSDGSAEILKEKSIVSSLLEEKKKLKSDFKIREDELLDKQIQLENKIKELDNILVKSVQSIQTMHMLSPKPGSFYHTEQKMALGYLNPIYLKKAQQKQQSLYNGKFLLEKHDPPAMYDSEETLQLAQENFKSLTKEADESLAKHKALELEIERLLRAVVSQDLMPIVQSNSVVDTSNLQSIKNVKNANITKYHTIKLIMTCNKRWKLRVTSNSVPTPQESKVMKNDNVIAPGMFRINPFKPSREEKYVPNKVRASIRTNPIIVSQPHVSTKKGVNSNLNGLSSTGVDNTAKTRRPQPRSNTKNDRVLLSLRVVASRIKKSK
nr:Gag-Pol polyprotein [Tanacetum cinerariifolium]